MALRHLRDVHGRDRPQLDAYLVVLARIVVRPVQVREPVRVDGALLVAENKASRAPYPRLMKECLLSVLKIGDNEARRIPRRPMPTSFPVTIRLGFRDTDFIGMITDIDFEAIVPRPFRLDRQAPESQKDSL